MDTLQIKICSKVVKLGLYLDERQTLIEKIVTRDSVKVAFNCQVKIWSTQKAVLNFETIFSHLRLMYEFDIECSRQLSFVKKSCTNGNFLAQS